jgi:hypothetical protein
LPRLDSNGAIVLPHHENEQASDEVPPASWIRIGKRTSSDCETQFEATTNNKTKGGSIKYGDNKPPWLTMKMKEFDFMVVRC